MKIEEYGFIGDLYTGALVGSNGSIDWLCVPRFDSGACFAALLGTDENGFWKIAPTNQTGPGRQRYLPETLILETTFESESGAVRVLDFMPLGDDRHDIVRIVEGVRGNVEMTMELVVRFDYGTTVPWVTHHKDGTRAIAGPNAVHLRSDVDVVGEHLRTCAHFSLKEKERCTFVFTWYSSVEDTPDPIDVARAFTGTEKYWRDWCSKCIYQGPWREAVLRSLITLKALTYDLTGGIVAALTTSLPEKIGGVRNWDYRYCWLRDATFTLYAMMGAGYTDEAARWTDWLLRSVAGDPSQLQILYGVAGERLVPEFELKYLSGYEGSLPVRVGNAAAEQLQLDVYGEIMDVNHLKREAGLKTSVDSWRVERHLIEFVIKNWSQPDEGIWEIRGQRRQFTHSKVMAWVTLDRGIKAVEKFGLEGDAARWKQIRAEIHADVCQNGYNRSQRVFTQYYGSDQLDASLLMIPLVGFLPIDDERVKRTIEAVQRDLTHDGLVLRYRPEKSAKVDGLPPGEATFLPCSFWLVDCLYLLGRKDEAQEFFERLLNLRSPLGLLAEEYDAREKRLLGNYPQAFSHVALINSANNLSVHLRPAEHRSSQHSR